MSNPQDTYPDQFRHGLIELQGEIECAANDPRLQAEATDWLSNLWCRINDGTATVSDLLVAASACDGDLGPLDAHLRSAAGAAR